MNKITFVPVKSAKAINRVEKLARGIWREHYTPIIGKAQVDYMLKKFQSKIAIAKQIKNSCLYYLINLNEKGSVGYLAFEPGKKEFYLSKFYILAACRGKGYGKKSIEFIKRLAADKGAVKITISVNKNNLNSILAYNKLGFKIKEKTVRGIGNGFIMDDYRMELKLQKQRPFIRHLHEEFGCL